MKKTKALSLLAFITIIPTIGAILMAFRPPQRGGIVDFKDITTDQTTFSSQSAYEAFRDSLFNDLRSGWSLYEIIQMNTPGGGQMIILKRP